MLKYSCLVFILGVLNGAQGSVIRNLPNLSARDDSQDVANVNMWDETKSNPFIIFPKPPLTHPGHHQAPAPLVDVEEGIFFEGDIILRPGQHFNSKLVKGNQPLKMLWPDGILYYDYSQEFDPQQRAAVESALSELQKETCVKFVHRTTQPTYIHLRNTKRGCASQVGYHPTGHGMDLYLSSPGCLRKGTIQHEFLHALGFWHEHTRPDRNRFINIYWENIIPGRELNFRARSQYEAHEWLPYDYRSIMHYRAIAFSKDRMSATIVPKDRSAFFAIGQRVRFSRMDLAKLNVLYSCGPKYYSGDTAPPENEGDIGQFCCELEAMEYTPQVSPRHTEAETVRQQSAKHQDSVQMSVNNDDSVQMSVKDDDDSVQMSVKDDDSVQMSVEDDDSAQMSVKDDDSVQMSAKDEDSVQMSAKDDDSAQMSVEDDDLAQMSAEDDDSVQQSSGKDSLGQSVKAR